MPLAISSRWGMNCRVTAVPTALLPGRRATGPAMKLWRTPIPCSPAAAVAALTRSSCANQLRFRTREVGTVNWQRDAVRHVLRADRHEFIL